MMRFALYSVFVSMILVRRYSPHQIYLSHENINSPLPWGEGARFHFTVPLPLGEEKNCDLQRDKFGEGSVHGQRFTVFMRRCGYMPVVCMRFICRGRFQTDLYNDQYSIIPGPLSPVPGSRSTVHRLNNSPTSSFIMSLMLSSKFT